MVKIISAVFLLFFLFTAEIKAQILINEVLPDPSTNDAQDEWVEIYNTGGSDVDINNYKLKDAANHELVVDSSYTGGSTVISANGWLVVQRNGHSTFSLNNSGQEIVYLYNTTDSNSIDSFTYTDSETDKSWGRVPDGGIVSTQTLNPSPGSANQVSNTPTLTPISTNTPTPTKTSSATLRVKEVKNEDGETLSNVKIYIDSNYTHHYAPEDINFCENCKCNECDNEIDLKFGSYVIKLEKGGYQDWSETKDIQSGNTVEIDAVLEKEVVSTNTPTPVKRITSTPTGNEKVKSLKTTGKPEAQELTDSDNENMVLGINEEGEISDLDNPDGVSDKTGKIPFTAVVFIIGGLVLVVAAAYPTLKAKLFAGGAEVHNGKD